jgi:formate-dependent nitrite reductase membrane component NrfD
METNFDWMVKYTGEREWIEKGGKLLWFAFVAGGLGTGLYLLSLYINNLWGIFLGWAIVMVLKGGFHLLDLGKPQRAWRLITNLQTSWISRGILFFGGFGLFGLLQMAPSLLPSLPWSADSVTLKTIAAIFAFLVMIYPGFTMSYVRAISLWNTGLIPIMLVAYAFFGGFGLTLLIALSTGMESEIMWFLDKGFRLTLFSTAIITAVFLLNVNYTNQAGQVSVRTITRGSAVKVFYLGAVICGFILPLIYSITSYMTHSISPSLLVIGVTGQIIGSFSVIYCLLRAGFYVPLVPGPTIDK